MQKQLSYKLHYFVCETCSYCDENDVQCLSGTAKALEKASKRRQRVTSQSLKSELMVPGASVNVSMVLRLFFILEVSFEIT